jgi:hypothetical protein
MLLASFWLGLVCLFDLLYHELHINLYLSRGCGGYAWIAMILCACSLLDWTGIVSIASQLCADSLDTFQNVLDFFAFLTIQAVTAPSLRIPSFGLLARLVSGLVPTPP